MNLQLLRITIKSVIVYLKSPVIPIILNHILKVSGENGEKIGHIIVCHDIVAQPEMNPEI